MAEVVGGPVTEEDESVVVSVYDKRSVVSRVSEPLDASVGMKDAVGEGKLRAGGMDQVAEWNGEGSDGGILVEFEGAGGPALLFSADGRLAIVWNVRPYLNGRTGVEPSARHRRGERELAGVKGDVEDRSLAERWAEGEHLRGGREGGGKGDDGRISSPPSPISFQSLAAYTREWAGISGLGGWRDNRQWGFNRYCPSKPIDAPALNTSQKMRKGRPQFSLSLSFSISLSR